MAGDNIPQPDRHRRHQERCVLSSAGATRLPFLPPNA
jgi:hypothetical protein